MIPREFKIRTNTLRFHEYVDRLFKFEPSYPTWMCVCKIITILNDMNLICKCNAYKVIACTFVLAHKYWEDDPYTMNIYSNITGISVNELINLEKIMAIDILYRHFSHAKIYRFNTSDEHGELKKLKKMNFQRCELC